MVRGSRERRGFGTIERLPSGNYRAYYADPEGRITATDKPRPVRHNASTTFTTREDAEAWLAAERRMISSGDWAAPAARRAAAVAAESDSMPTVREWADTYLADKRKPNGEPLSIRYIEETRGLLRNWILPTFGDTPLDALTPVAINRWWLEVLPSDKPPTRAAAFGTLAQLLNYAVKREVLLRAPHKGQGSSKAPARKPLRILTPDEIAAIAAEMPAHRRLAVLLAAWCQLRIGEVTALQRGDVDTRSWRLRVERAATDTKSQGTVVKKTKNEEVRWPEIPESLRPLVADHLLRFTDKGSKAWLFPNALGDGPIPYDTFMGKPSTWRDDGKRTKWGYGYNEAKRKAGIEGIGFHTMRHTGSTLYAATGATLAEIMVRGGWKTQSAAMIYQHAAEGRDSALTAKLPVVLPRRPVAETTVQSLGKRKSP